jgi:hypothetical protein
LSKRRSIRFVTRLVVLGIAVGTLAAYSAHSKRSMRADAASPDSAEPQLANREAKTDRLPRLIPTSLTSAEPSPVYGLASTPAADDLDRPSGALAMATSIPPIRELAPATAPAGPKHVALAPPAHEPAPMPPQKPKRQPPLAAASGILDDNQIAGLKGRLRLTSEQAEYWPAVEEALRDVVRTQLRGHHQPHGKLVVDVNAPEVQKLIWAAMPLLMRLRDDQKGEVRKLARVIGLEQVASQI